MRPVQAENPRYRIAAWRLLIAVAVVYAFVLAIQKTSAQAIENVSGEILVLQVDPEQLADILQRDSDIGIEDILFWLRAAHRSEMAASDISHSLLTIVHGPLERGAIVRVTISALLPKSARLPNGGKAGRTFDYEIKESTKRNPLLILNEFSVPNPADITFRAFVNWKQISEVRVQGEMERP